MSDEEPLNVGVYISQSGLQIPYAIMTLNNKFAVVLEGVSRGIAGIGLCTGMYMNGRLFYISSSEFINFNKNVIDKNISWVVLNKLNEIVEIPGTWHSTIIH